LTFLKGYGRLYLREREKMKREKWRERNGERKKEG